MLKQGFLVVVTVAVASAAFGAEGELPWWKTQKIEHGGEVNLTLKEIIEQCASEEAPKQDTE